LFQFRNSKLLYTNIATDLYLVIQCTNALYVIHSKSLKLNLLKAFVEFAKMVVILFAESLLCCILDNEKKICCSAAASALRIADSIIVI